VAGGVETSATAGLIGARGAAEGIFHALDRIMLFASQRAGLRQAHQHKTGCTCTQTDVAQLSGYTPVRVPWPAGFAT
jgi:hypothetical protein